MIAILTRWKLRMYLQALRKKRNRNILKACLWHDKVNKTILFPSWQWSHNYVTHEESYLTWDSHIYRMEDSLILGLVINELAFCFNSFIFCVYWQFHTFFLVVSLSVHTCGIYLTTLFSSIALVLLKRLIFDSTSGGHFCSLSRVPTFQKMMNLHS